MADRMPRPPMWVPAGGSNHMLIEYLERLCDAMDRAVREQEQKIQKLEQEMQKIKKEDDGK